MDMKKQVSFGDARVHEVEKIPLNQQRQIWYDRGELDDLYEAEVAEMKDCGKKCWKGTSKCEEHTFRGLESHNVHETRNTPHKHVRHVISIFRIQMKQHDGRWNPNRLRRVSKYASKENRNVAQRRARKDFAEVNNDNTGLISKIFNMVRPRQA